MSLPHEDPPRDERDRDGLASGTTCLLGFKLLDREPARGVLRAQYEATSDLADTHGAVKPGLLAAMLDDAMGRALAAMLSAEQAGPRVEFKVSFLRPAGVGPLFAEARVVAQRSSTAFLSGDLRDPKGELVATATGTASIVRRPSAVSPFPAAAPDAIRPTTLPTVANRARLRGALAVVALLILIEATPSLGWFHGRLKAAIDPVLDVSGLWQNSWRLFAPDVDRLNARIEADVLFENGKHVRWKSQEHPHDNTWQRFFLYRHARYYDGIRKDRNREAWRPLALHLARTIPPPEGTARVTQVALKRVWGEIPKLTPGATLLPAGPYEAYDHSYVFYTWKPDSK